jgi:hypothetical protein
MKAWLCEKAGKYSGEKGKKVVSGQGYDASHWD